MSRDEIRVAYDKGIALLQIDRAGDALEVLGRGLNLDPENAELLTAMAWAQLKLGDLPAGLRCVEHALAHAPQWEWPHRLRSSFLLRLGRDDDALQEAQAAMRLAPEDPLPLQQLFTVQRAMKAFDDAWTTAYRLLQLAPEEATSHIDLGLAQLDHKQWSAAETSFRRALELDPESSTALNNLGVALRNQNKNKEAIEAFYGAARLAPQSQLARNNLGSTMKKYLSTAGLGIISVVIFVQVAAGIGKAFKLTDDQQTAIIFGGLALSAVAIFVVRRSKVRRLPTAVRGFVDDVSRAERRRLVHVILTPIMAFLFLGVICGVLGIVVDRSWETIVGFTIAVILSIVTAIFWWRTRAKPTPQR